MNMIVAADSKWGIGRDNGLLASLPSDMKYFREHTLGKVVVMGRKTLESLPGQKGLPGRINIVLSTNKHFEAEGCRIVHSEYQLFDELAQYDPDDIYLIGGASLYNRFYKYCSRLYVTKMDADLNADAFIVNIDEDEDYSLISESEPVTENGITFRFLVYSRNSEGLNRARTLRF
ncbi:MAG: dihydrofolate reductase [Mogibacterium sp.]|nr:dihydrofolate reductase [Mogibacterium sp.]